MHAPRHQFSSIRFCDHSCFRGYLRIHEPYASAASMISASVAPLASLIIAITSSFLGRTSFLFKCACLRRGESAARRSLFLVFELSACVLPSPWARRCTAFQILSMAIGKFLEV